MLDNECFCAHLSQDAGEELYGTASTVDTWFLLEYTGRWAADAFTESDLPHSVKARLAECLSQEPRSRLLFLKHDVRRATGPAFYIARSREQNPVLYEFRLDAYQDLVDLDIPAILREDPAYSAYLSGRPVFLVCTHGVHDKCCAKYGRPVYAALAQREDVVAWQSSHVGGDRFAANVVCLPQGIYYGRVDAERDVDAIVAASQRGAIHLDAYRGRSCYSFAVQAAEYYIRRQTGSLHVDALRLGGVRREHGGWTVTFQSTGDALQHTVQVSREAMGLQNFLVCKAREPSDLMRYRLDGYAVLHPE